MTERKHLREPPIVEVVCGFSFDAMAVLDPVAIGLYWHRRRQDFPAKQLHPAVGQAPGIVLGLGPLRTWLVSENGEHVVQVQQDRFYFNWRGRGARYPHFNTYEERGVLDRCLDEFVQFSAFCQEELGKRPAPTGLELAKIDMLEQGRHWSDFTDLGRVVPALSGLRSVLQSPQPVLQMQMFEARGDREIHVQINNAVVTSTFVRGVQIETRIVASSSGEPRSTFSELNEMANATFRALIPETEWHRFGGVR
ncbi:MAG: TIGR04255 family protein [Deltaproteobacteria bacterium]|nr:TIGR04255 family protein [Deltaproteobacteria bacterium]